MNIKVEHFGMTVFMYNVKRGDKSTAIKLDNTIYLANLMGGVRWNIL